MAVAPTRALAEAPPAAQPAGQAAWPVVDVRGERGVLESQPSPSPDDDPRDDDWRAVCRLPCRRPLDPSLVYRVAGRGVVDGAPFSLAPGRSNLRLDVEAGSRVGRITGIVLTPVGGAVLLGGLLAAFMSGVRHEGGDTRLELLAAGGGAMVMTTGILLICGNRTTVTRGEPGGPSLQLTSGVSLTPRGFVF
jgi:hypothetical protein